jgi:hypothetical protein
VNSDAAAVAVDLLDLLDGGDEIACLALAVVTQHFEAEQLRLRRHTRYGVEFERVRGHLAFLVTVVGVGGDQAVRFGHLAGDNPCNMCPMAKDIDQRRLILFTEHSKIPMVQRRLEG